MNSGHGEADDQPTGESVPDSSCDAAEEPTPGAAPPPTRGSAEESNTGPEAGFPSFSDRRQTMATITTALARPPVGLVLLEMLVDAEQVGGPVDPVLLGKTLHERIAKEADAADIILTTGPDRLTVIKPGLTAPAQAEGFARRVHAALQSPMLVGEGRVTCLTAIGVAASRQGDTADHLMSFAQHALGDARMLGGDTVVAFDDQDRDLIIR